MFDSYHNHSKEYVPYDKNVYITEKKAPTDDSARLIKELEEKAIEKIFHTASINNELNASVVYMNDIWRKKFIAKFNLNGHEYTVEDHIDERRIFASFKMGSHEVLNAVVKSLSEKIAKEIILKIMKDDNYA